LVIFESLLHQVSFLRQLGDSKKGSSLKPDYHKTINKFNQDMIVQICETHSITNILRKLFLDNVSNIEFGDKNAKIYFDSNVF
jgi:hypothetical protein